MSSRLILLAYAAISLVMTWPVPLGLGRDVAGDLGDSLLNMWILGWGVEHVPLLLTGQIGWADYWNANIFHPNALALALSEHLFGQTLQVLPIYWLTHNLIVCYNLLFISSFALSAFGTYLLVRDLTGDKRAAFIAGLIYGFLPYRIASVPHVQVMSSQWMPFALYGLNRFVTTGSWRALAAGAFALVMQNWSCGYYLLYFAPFVPLFVLHRMWTTGKLVHVRTWMGLLAAAVVTLVLTLPFLLPYSESQKTFGFERNFAEIVAYSANMWSYATASKNVRVWGKILRYYPQGEGETFLGFVPWLLASIASVSLVAWRQAPSQEPAAGGRWRGYLTAVLVIAVVTQFIAVTSAVTLGGFDVELLGTPISARTPQRLLLQFVIALALLLGVSRRARVEALRIIRAPEFLLLSATVLAIWLSLGPIPKTGAVLISDFSLYNLLYRYVPGFNGVRAPARYAMIAGLFLAVWAGYGYHWLARYRRLHRNLFPLAAAMILLEGAAIPMETNRTWNQHEAMPPAQVYPARQAPPVYARVAALPAGSAITEFPFGDVAWEIRYVYYSTAHWKPITNGYSGNFPPKYKEWVALLQRVHEHAEPAWQALRESGTTHVIVHRNAFANTADADTVESWLKAHGARELERFPDNDILLSIN